ncbi:imm11 family protein [Vibrio owensii]|uniref:imm11 family protein n=1 Tax=Vibrio owensii TaxID=696485 RepID=UPI003CC7C406
MDSRGKKMNHYNEKYYIVFEKYDENTLYLKPQKHSAMRDYEFTKLSGSEPMFFENGYREEDAARGVSRSLKKAHLDSTYPVITVEIKKSLGKVENEYFQLFPAVIVDDSGKYHEEYWVFNVFEKMDVLNLEECDIDDFDPEETRHTIDKYSLDTVKLDALPEKERLVFMPKCSDYPHIMVHESVVKVFKKHNVDTLNFVKVSDWEAGLQFVS